MNYKYFSNNKRNPTDQTEYYKSTWYMYQLYVEYRKIKKSYLKGKRIRKGLHMYNFYKFSKFSLFWKNVDLHNSYFNNNNRRKYAIICRADNTNRRTFFGYFRIRQFSEVKHNKIKYFFNPFLYFHINHLYEYWRLYFIDRLKHFSVNTFKIKIGDEDYLKIIDDELLKYYKFRNKKVNRLRLWYGMKPSAVRKRRNWLKIDRRYRFHLYKRRFKVRQYILEHGAFQTKYFTNEGFFWTPIFRYLRNLFFLHNKKAPWYFQPRRPLRIQRRICPSKTRKMRKRPNIFRYRFRTFYRFYYERYYIHPTKKKSLKKFYKDYYQERFNNITIKYSLFLNKLRERYFMDLDQKNRFWIDGFLNYCKNWTILFPKRRNEYLATLKYEFLTKSMYINNKIFEKFKILRTGTGNMFVPLKYKNRINNYNKYYYNKKEKLTLLKGILFYLFDKLDIERFNRYTFKIKRNRPSILQFFLKKMRLIQPERLRLKKKRPVYGPRPWNKPYYLGRRDRYLFFLDRIRVYKLFKRFVWRLIMRGYPFYRTGLSPFNIYDKSDDMFLQRRVFRLKKSKVRRRFFFRYFRRPLMLTPLLEGKCNLRSVFVPTYYLRRSRINYISLFDRGNRKRLTKIGLKKIHESKVPSYFFFWKRVWVNDNQEDIFLYLYLEYIKNVNKMYNLYSKNLLWYDKLYNIGVNTEAYGTLFTNEIYSNKFHFWKLISRNNFIFSNDHSVSIFDYLDYTFALPFLHINKLSLFDLIFNPKRQSQKVIGLFQSYYFGSFDRIRLKFEYTQMMAKYHFLYLDEEVFDDVAAVFIDEGTISNKTGKNFLVNPERGLFKYTDEFVYYYAPISYIYSYSYCFFSICFIGFLFYLRHVYYNKYNPLFVEEYLFLRKHIYWARFALINMFFWTIIIIVFYLFTYGNFLNFNVFDHSSIYFQKYDFIFFLLGQVILFFSSIYLYLSYILYIKYTKLQFYIYILCNSIVFLLFFYLPLLLSKIFLYNKLILPIQYPLYNNELYDFFTDFADTVDLIYLLSLDEDFLTPFAHYFYNAFAFLGHYGRFSFIYIAIGLWWSAFYVLFQFNEYYKDASDYEVDEDIEFDTLNTQNSQVDNSNGFLYLIDKLENNIYYNSIYFLEFENLNRNNYVDFLKDILKFESGDEFRILYRIIERNNIDFVTLIYLSTEELGSFFYSENSLISIDSDENTNGELDFYDLDFAIIEEFEDLEEELDDLDDFEIVRGEQGTLQGNVTAADLIFEYKHRYEESDFFEEDLFVLNFVDLEKYIYFVQNYHYLLNYLRKQYLANKDNIQISHVIFDFFHDFNSILGLRKDKDILVYSDSSDSFKLFDDLIKITKSYKVEKLIFNYIYNEMYSEFDEDVEIYDYEISDFMFFGIPSELAILFNMNYTVDNTMEDPVSNFDFMAVFDSNYFELLATEMEVDLLYEDFEFNVVGLSFLYDFSYFDVMREIYPFNRYKYLFSVQVPSKFIYIYYNYLPIYTMELWFFYIKNKFNIKFRPELKDSGHPEYSPFFSKFVDMQIPNKDNYTKIKLKDDVNKLKIELYKKWDNNLYKSYYRMYFKNHFLYSHMYIINKKRRPLYYCIYI